MGMGGDLFYASEVVTAIVQGHFTTWYDGMYLVFKDTSIPF
jgi:hypothetical protein